MPCDLLSNAKITGPPIGTHSLLVLCTGYYFDLSFNALFDPCFYIVRVLQRRGGGGVDPWDAEQRKGNAAATAKMGVIAWKLNFAGNNTSSFFLV